MTLSYNIYS